MEMVEDPKIIDIIRNIADGYISALKMADIPDSALSDADVMESVAGEPRELVRTAVQEESKGPLQNVSLEDEAN